MVTKKEKQERKTRHHLGGGFLYQGLRLPFSAYMMTYCTQHVKM